MFRLLKVLPLIFLCVLPLSCFGSNTIKTTTPSSKNQPVGAGSNGKALRKEYRRLTDDERTRFHAALNRLKIDKIDNYTKYDLVSVVYNLRQYAPGAYYGPAFLPWHREQLKQLEMALREYDNSVAIPYWDTTLDEGLPNPSGSILWTDDFLGTGNGTVTTGPFKNWKALIEIETIQNLFDTSGNEIVWRKVGEAENGRLYSPQDLESFLNVSTFGQLTFCVDKSFELIHGAVHMWVGGYMSDMQTAPNDPTFFLLSAFTDWIWEAFRQRKQTKAQRENDYPPQSEACNTNHYFNSTMKPFEIRNGDGLSSTYTENFYSYEARPTCSPNGKPIEGQCGSKYLACDRKRWRCLSKIRLGANCTGFENAEEELCYNSKCVQGLCT